MMKIPISNRLLLCASMVPPLARVADVGTDHGYLGIWLLKNGAASFVTASDLREGPLRNAKNNARRFGMEARMDFVLSDGLQNLSPECADTVVCAGMGGDLIVSILAACDWLRDARYTLILQPQSAGNALRGWLGENGFSIEQEQLTRDGGFLYTALKARYTGGGPLTPAQQYVTPQLAAAGGPLLAEYVQRIEKALASTIEGLRTAKTPCPERLAYFEEALAGIREMKKEWQA